MKNLICINTYNSPALIKTFIWDYILFAQSRSDFDFVVSLDGSNQETIDYCSSYAVPLIYSDKNEGVGLSKNRVISSFPDYDTYFFIEDDVELLNPEVFDIHLLLSRELQIPHFSLFDKSRIREMQTVREAEGYHIIGALYGSAQVNFFTRKGLEKTGGFHPEFAKYKRFGHTEHSYRFYHAGLSDYPFQIIQECLDGYFAWHEPVSRVKLDVDETENHLFVGEEELITQKLSYFPLQTLSPYQGQDLENVIHTENIRIDKAYPRYKKHFLRKMALLNLARKTKALTKTLRGSTE